MFILNLILETPPKYFEYENASPCLEIHVDVLRFEGYPIKASTQFSAFLVSTPVTLIATRETFSHFTPFLIKYIYLTKRKLQI